MKFKDIAAFAFKDWKNHKGRFFITALLCLMVSTLIFAITYIAFSTQATAREDMRMYVSGLDGAVQVNIGKVGARGDEEGYSVMPEDIAVLKEHLSAVGEVQGVKTYEITREVRFAGALVRVKAIENSGVTVSEGLNIEEAPENAVWLSAFYAALAERYLHVTDIVGKSYSALIEGKSIDFVVAGVLSEDDYGIYAKSDYLYKSGAAAITNAEIALKIPDGEYSTMDALSGAIDKAETQIYPQGGALSSPAVSHYKDLITATALTAVLAAVAAVFFALLMLSVLRNNAVIGIYDNIRLYSLMRCLGVRRTDIGLMAAAEISVCVTGASLIAVGLSHAFAPLCARAASVILDTSACVFAWQWWVDIICVFAFAAFAAVYVAVTLYKTIKKKKLLSTVRNEV